MNEEEFKSKSQKKREANAFTELGEALVKLNKSKLDKLPLSPLLMQAIHDAKNMKSFGAIRRQTLWIGKLIRETQAEALVEAYEALQMEDSSQTAGFHHIEEWRARLMQEGKEALTQFIDAYPQVDIQHLRQLIKKANDDVQHEKNTGAQRALFRYIRSFIQ